MFGWFFFSALYMQRALGFTALQTGLGYLPATLLIGAFSYALTARIIERRGVRAPLVAGALLSALGLASFALAPADGSFVANVLPGMLLLGTGGGLLFMPLILAATTSAAPRDAGSASGLVSTSQQLGGAVGLAVLAALAASRARHLRAGHSQIAAVTGGFHLAFALSAALALVAAVIGFALLPAAAETSLARAEPRPSPDTRRGGR
jgi:MFS family permease